MTFDEFMMAYDYAGQLKGLHKPSKRSGIDKESLRAEVEAIHKRIGK